MSENPPDNVETRLTGLEHQVASLREQVALAAIDAGAARVLASGADRDVSEVRAELRAHTKALNALRETQLEQGHEITELRHDTASLRHDTTTLRQDLTNLDQRMETGFTSLEEGMAQVHATLAKMAPEG